MNEDFQVLTADQKNEMQGNKCANKVKAGDALAGKNTLKRANSGLFHGVSRAQELCIAP